MNAAPENTGHSTTDPRVIGDTPQGGSVLGFYAPKGSPRPPRIARGEGIYLWDTEGRRYLDATAGAVVVNLGHGNRNVLAAMAEQAQRATFAYPRFFESEHSVALADSVCALACKGFDRAFFVSGGSEANESALKLCRQYAVVRGETQRWKVISREPSYHGATLGALAVTGDAHTRSRGCRPWPRAHRSLATCAARGCSRPSNWWPTNRRNGNCPCRSTRPRGSPNMA